MPRRFRAQRRTAALIGGAGVVASAALGMNWHNAYRITLSLLVLVSLAGAAWLVIDPGATAPGVEITPASQRPAPPSTEVPTPTPAEQRPTATASEPSTPVTGSTVEPTPGEQRPATIDINSAFADELMELPGIGEVLAARIVAYRTANGPFVRGDQLMAVDGIGTVTYERLRPHIRVGEGGGQ